MNEWRWRKERICSDKPIVARRSEAFARLCLKNPPRISFAVQCLGNLAECELMYDQSVGSKVLEYSSQTAAYIYMKSSLASCFSSTRSTPFFRFVPHFSKGSSHKVKEAVKHRGSAEKKQV